MFSENKNVGLIDIINAIENAKQMMISKEFLNNTSALGMAQSKALRDALESFKKSGKFVMAYANRIHKRIL
jgi:protease-4